MSALNYNHLRYFWAVAHEGNLTRAAEKLAVSQSSLSVQVQKLENQLGHPLFERRGKQLLLTEAGRIALDHADAIFSTGRELVSVLKDRDTSERVLLRIGADATLSRNFQLRFLEPILGRDDARIVIQSAELSVLLNRLQNHQIDVVLSNVPPVSGASTPWIAHKVATQSVSLLGYAHRCREGESLAETVEREPLLLPSADNGVRVLFDAMVARLGLSPKIAAEVDDMAMLRVLVSADAGVAVVPPIVVSQELTDGPLIEFHALPDILETFYAITLTRRFPNRLLSTLLTPEGNGAGSAPTDLSD